MCIWDDPSTERGAPVPKKLDRILLSPHFPKMLKSSSQYFKRACLASKREAQGSQCTQSKQVLFTTSRTSPICFSRCLGPTSLQQMMLLALGSKDVWSWYYSLSIYVDSNWLREAEQRRFWCPAIVRQSLTITGNTTSGNSSTPWEAFYFPFNKHCTSGSKLGTVMFVENEEDHQHEAIPKTAICLLLFLFSSHPEIGRKEWEVEREKRERMKEKREKNKSPLSDFLYCLEFIWIDVFSIKGSFSYWTAWYLVF